MAATSFPKLKNVVSFLLLRALSQYHNDVMAVTAIDKNAAI